MFEDESEGVMLIGLCSIEVVVLEERFFWEGEEEGNFKISLIFGILVVKEEELHESGVIGVLFVFRKEEIGVEFWLLFIEIKEFSL